jgi:dihydrofolate reductase
MAPIAHVVAVARNGVIGVGGGLPWRLPGDLKHFKAVTMGHPVVMGRKTYDSIGRPLPGRANIVVTRNPDFRPGGVQVAADIDAALGAADALCRARAAADGEAWIMVIGGGEIYRQTMGRAQRLYLTEIDADVDGDTRYPAFDRTAFAETERRNVAADGDAPAHRYITLERTG